jgi:hypothetical protein
MRVFSRALMLTAAAVFATGALAAGAPVKGPRTKDGKPDLNGIWQAMNSANFDLEPHAARAAMAMVPGQFVPVPAPEVVKMGAVGSVPAGLGVVEGDTIPYLPAALERKKENQKNWLTSDPEIKCYLPGVPRANYMPYPFQIFQSKDYVFFAYEYAGAVRNIYMKDPGHHHSDSLKVTERWTQKGPDHLWYEATIEDPKTFSRPWKISMPLYRRVEPNAQLMQFKCVEFVEELMYGDLRKKPTQPAPPKEQKE